MIDPLCTGVGTTAGAGLHDYEVTWWHPHAQCEQLDLVTAWTAADALVQWEIDMAHRRGLPMEAHYYLREIKPRGLAEREKAR